jgi:type IV pilus assembly protein PilA
MKLRNLKLNNDEKGFTLIELMIVVAIIGILAAVAIPNFISYRDKSFCSGAESDANNVLAALADYYAIPSNTADPTIAGLNMQLSGDNTGTLAYVNTANTQTITVTITDGSGRCPLDYRTAAAAQGTSWGTAAVGVYTKVME